MSCSTSPVELNGVNQHDRGANPGALQSGRRYEYDGLNLLRVDELYDSTGNGLTEDDAWRRLEVNTHGPGTLGALLGKRVYTYAEPDDSTPSGQNDYTYTYDAVGNVVAVYNANSTGRGNELYYFTQDAFGNELSSDGNLPTWQRVNLLGGSQWGTARTAGISEHQTGKWIDPFTGMYYFHARWYDSGVGRFVGRAPASRAVEHPYTFVANCPPNLVDPVGRKENPPGGWQAGIPHQDPSGPDGARKWAIKLRPPDSVCWGEIDCHGKMKDAHPFKSGAFKGRNPPRKILDWLAQQYGKYGKWGSSAFGCMLRIGGVIGGIMACNSTEAVDPPPCGSCCCEDPIPELPDVISICPAIGLPFGACDCKPVDLTLE